ncbi:MAG TPA: hypothetical protein VH396_05370 [Chitinophagaceae bacterium]|jgi:flagellar motor switch protein FliM
MISEIEKILDSIIRKMNVKVRQIRREDYEKVHQFQREYLEVELIEDFVKRVKANPDLYLVALIKKN